LRPLIVFKRAAFVPAWLERARPNQEILLAYLVMAIFIFTHWSLVLFGKLYMHNNFASAFTYVIGDAFIYVTNYQRMFMFASLKIMSSNKDTATRVQRARIAIAAVVGVIIVCHTITILGIWAAPTVSMKFGFAMGLAISTAVTGWVAPAIYFVVCRSIEKSIETHIKEMGRLGTSKTSPGSIRAFERALERLRRTKVNAVFASIFAGGISTIVAILPPIQTYWFPATLCILPLGSLQVLFDMRVPKRTDSDTSASAQTSGSRSAVVSGSRSLSEETSSNPV
jgi:hypothetical protein